MMTLEFCSRFYSRAAIAQAVRRYKKYAKLSVRHTRRASFVRIEGVPDRFAASLPGEFSNFVLAVSLESVGRERQS